MASTMNMEVLVSNPEIVVYGKENCGLCEAAKKKLEIMGVEYCSQSIESIMEHHEGWRDDGACAVSAMYALKETLPIIQLDGVVMTYPQTMKALKQRSKDD